MAVRGTRPRTPEAAAIRYATDLKGWDYERLADEMRRATGDKRWVAGMFERIALGRRKVHTDELAPISDVLGIPVGFLVRGPEGADLIPNHRAGWFGYPPSGQHGLPLSGAVHPPMMVAA